MVGCATFNDHEGSLIRIESSRNPVKAQRLTLAGVNALENGKRDYALEKLLSAIDADPEYGPAHNNLGLLQFDDGKLYDLALRLTVEDVKTLRHNGVHVGCEAPARWTARAEELNHQEAKSGY